MNTPIAAGTPADRIPLRAALHAAAQELNRQEPPAWLAHTTLARAAAVLPHPAAGGAPARRFGGWWTGAAATFASVLLVSVLLLIAVPAPRPDDATLHQASRPSGFLPLVSAQTLTDAADRPAAAWLVETEMPRDRLAALGLPFDPGRAGDSVRAELLMHPSGQVLAVRLMPE
jgi:hypothetical protein